MTKAPTTRETADHAELAAMKPEDHRVRAVMLACESRMKGYETPIHAADAKFALDYLLSEIAALRGERDDLKRHRDRLAITCQRRLGDWRSAQVQATQAERQRDELREALELAAERFEALRDLTDHVPHRIACSTWADEARQANQGADKL